MCQFCSLKTTNTIIQQLQDKVAALKCEHATVKDLSTKQNTSSTPLPNYAAAAAAIAVNPQQGQRPPRTRTQQRRPANPPATRASTARVARASEAAKNTTSQGPRKVALVPGKRAVWGTIYYPYHGEIGNSQCTICTG